MRLGISRHLNRSKKLKIRKLRTKKHKGGAATTNKQLLINITRICLQFKVQQMRKKLIEDLIKLFESTSEQDRDAFKIIGNENMNRNEIISSLEDKGNQDELIKLIVEGQKQAEAAKENKIRADKAEREHQNAAAAAAEHEESTKFLSSNSSSPYLTAIDKFQRLFISPRTSFKERGTVITLVHNLRINSTIINEYFKDMCFSLPFIKMDESGAIELNVSEKNNANIKNKGSFGTIYKSRTKDIVYKKLYPKDSNEIKTSFTEAWIQNLLSNDERYGSYIPKIKGIYRDYTTVRSSSGEAPIILYIVMESIPFSKNELLTGTIQLDYVRPFLNNVAEVLKYFKDTYNFFHNDLHFGNILWRTKDILSFVIIDFGFSSIQFLDKVGNHSEYSLSVSRQVLSASLYRTDTYCQELLKTKSTNWGLDLVQLLCSFFTFTKISKDLLKFILLVCKPKNKIYKSPYVDLMTYIINESTRVNVLPIFVLANGINIHEVLASGNTEVISSLTGTTPEGVQAACENLDDFRLLYDPDDLIGAAVEKSEMYRPFLA